MKVGAIAIGLAAVGLLAAGIRWNDWLGQTRDPGPVAFSSLRRSVTGSDALICPVSVCLKTPPDLEPPIFTSSATHVEQELRNYARGLHGVDEIATGRSSGLFRFVERSSLFSAPTFVDVMVEPLSADASTVVIYARNAGSPDRSARLEGAKAWLDALGN